ncbi:MAG: hypothetical protein IKP62_05305 [Salinivirgaceae bacterium]|nr:hypothetical protein [Salinivirgaceae bacterium]
MKHLLPKTTLRALALKLFVGIAAESSAHSDIVSTNLKPMDTISATALFCPSE